MVLDEGNSNETEQNTHQDLEDSAQQFEEVLDEEQSPEQVEVEESEDDDDLKLADDESETQDGQENIPENSLVEILGEKRPAKEWKDGFLRQDDYTRKAQELAQKRAYIDQEMQIVTESRKKYAAGLGLLTHEAEQELKQYDGVDWAYMAQVNQEDYIKYRSKFEAAQERVFKLQDESEEFFNSVTEQDKIRSQQSAVECIKTLKSVFSNWNSEAYYGLIEYGASIGMNKNQLLNSTDPGVFIMLHKARQFDKTKQIRNKLTNQKQKPSRVLSGRGIKVQSGNKKTQAMANFQKSGTLDDAVSVFENMV